MTRREPEGRAQATSPFTADRKRHARLKIAGATPVAPTRPFSRGKGPSPSQRASALIPRGPKQLLQEKAAETGGTSINSMI